MRNLRKERGITLIALVITIIVLLILATVSIATLTGENGILKKATDAKKETEIASAIEQARADILAWEVKNKGNSNLTDEIVQEILSGKDYVQGEPGDTSFTTKDGNYVIEYSKLYEKKASFTYNPETLEIGTPINSEKYGYKVGGYTVTTPEFTTGVWRLFYQDSNYTYLITDEITNVKYKPSDYYTTVTKEDGELKYQTGADVGTIGQKLSKKLIQAGTFFVESNTNDNIRSTAWLTDTEADIWKQYKNEDAVFAIGSPTAELYKASFDATASANNATTFSLEAGTYGYTNGTTSKQLKTEYNYGIYNKSTSSNWWLASPNSANSSGSGGLHVDGLNGYFGISSVDGGSNAVRPLVCIPTSVFNSDYASTLVNQ